MRSTLAWLAHRARKLGWRLFRPTTVGVRALVLDGDGRVLLVRHSYAAGWYLPGGGVGRGESFLDGLRRELIEEVGIEPIRPPRLLGLYSSTFEGKGDHIGVFIVDEWRRSETQSPEVIGADWFHPDRLPVDTSPATRRRIAEHLGQRSLDYVW